MKRQFTDEEIRNCRKIAEKGERKTVEYGDWCYSEIYWPSHGDRGVIDQKRVELWRSHVPADENTAHTPLWQIHDCLEWLIKKGFYIERLGQDDEYLWSLEIYKFDSMNTPRIVMGTKAIYGGKSKLEPCLCAVLSKMGEKNYE